MTEATLASTALTGSRLLAITLLLLALGSAGSAFWIDAKAVVAQHLLALAWQRGVQDGDAPPPWPWADVRPVARLAGDGLDDALMILSDASGEAMAFGPGLVAGNPQRLTSETIVLGGHRDTHLAFAEHLAIDDVLEVENLSGRTQRYRVDDLQVVDSRSNTVAVSRDRPGLVLITCYPFSAAQTGGPLRYVVSASAMPESVQTVARYEGGM